MYKIVFLILISLTTIFAQSAGSSGLSFLKMGFGARNIALGDAGAALSNDVTALYYNPAGLADSYNGEVLLMHNEWIQDVRSELLGASFKLFNIPFAVGFNVTTVKDIEVRTKPGEPDSKFNANYFFGSLSTGFYIIENISVGASVKYLYEGLFSDEATGIGFDFGAKYSTPVNGLSVSASIKNLGSMSILKNEESKLPSEMRIGTAYSFEIPDSKFSFIAAGELQKYLQTEDIHLNFGGEILFNKMFALRAGYQSGYISKNLTGGVGLNWGGLSFDYAVSPFSLQLGTGHSMSVSFRF